MKENIIERKSKKPANGDLPSTMDAGVEGVFSYVDIIKSLRDKKELLAERENALRKEKKMEDTAYSEKHFNLENAVNGLKAAINVLEKDKKATAKDIAKVVGDPRWRMLLFDRGVNMSYPSTNPSRKDN